jgi:hypothetical protein
VILRKSVSAAFCGEKSCFAEFIDVVEKYSILIGIAIAVLLFAIVPPLRRALIRAFEEGKKDGQRWRSRGKKKAEDNQ